MGNFVRGAWVRHRPTGRLGRIEVAGDELVSVAPFPPDSAGWLTAAASDFEPLSRGRIPCPAPQDDLPPACLGRAA